MDTSPVKFLHSSVTLDKPLHISLPLVFVYVCVFQYLYFIIRPKMDQSDI